MSLLSINSLHLTVSVIYTGQDFKGQTHYNKVKGQITHLHPLTNVPAKYQLLTPYGSEDRSQRRI